MPLPPKPFHGILELASRWQVDPLAIRRVGDRGAACLVGRAAAA